VERINRTINWLNDPKGVNAIDKISLVTAKSIFILFRKILKYIIGTKRRDKLFGSRYITFVSILRLIKKSPILVKNEDGVFLCRTNETDVIMISDEHEQFLKEKYHLKENDVVFDIGAHIGKYAIRVGKMIGNGGKVFAIEIEPNTYELLSRNIALNGLEKIVQPLKIAISNKSGKADFFISKGRSEVNSMHDKWGERIEIQTTTIDELIEKNGLKKVNLIQMDIQGAEYEAILGAVKSIESKIIDTFIIETHSKENFNLIPPLLIEHYNIEIFARTGPDFGYLICKSKSNLKR
jgi:FkbM family methyltransferase